MTLQCERWPDMVVGTTYPVPFTVKNPVTGAAVDISNWQYEAIYEPALDGSPADEILLHTYVAGTGGNENPTVGIGELRIESTETINAPVGMGFMKIRRTVLGSSPLDVRLIGPFPIKVKAGS